MQSGSRDVSMPAHVRDSLEQDLKNVQGLKHSLDARRLVALAKRFYAARRIVLLAGDLAVSLAQYLEYQISLLGLPIFAATSAGRILHVVRSVNKRDLVLAISFRRGLRQTVEGAHQARARGAYCVGISDTYVSPLSRGCNEVFLASVESTSFGASYAAPTVLINAILAAVGHYRRTQTLAVAREIAEEQRKGFRWYDT
jgi:DNA-binding MurR/RpiR family transcriptional regulator